MKQYCKHCQKWQPLDDSFEIGARFREPELPLGWRFRFKHEIWGCWRVSTGSKLVYPVAYKPLDLPEPEPVPADVKAVTDEFKRELNAEVGKAYWYIRKLAKKARINGLGAD